MSGYTFDKRTGLLAFPGAGSCHPIPQALPPTAQYRGVLSTSQKIGWPAGKSDAPWDAPAYIWPQNTERRVLEDSTVDYMERILPPLDLSNVHPVGRDWLKKIGKFLAVHVLRIEGAESKEWYLESLPENYGLFIHKKGDKDNPRVDAYLFGPREINCFRSPAEFFLHARWLFCKRDEGYDCGCTYCSGRSQGPISEKYSNYNPKQRKTSVYEPERENGPVGEGNGSL